MLIRLPVGCWYSYFTFKRLTPVKLCCFSHTTLLKKTSAGYVNIAYHRRVGNGNRLEWKDYNRPFMSYVTWIELSFLWYLELIRLGRSSDSVGNNNTSHDATIYTYTEACEHGPGRRYGLVIATRRDDGYWNEVQEQPKSPAIFANGRTELNVVASRNESRGNYRCFQ